MPERKKDTEGDDDGPAPEKNADADNADNRPAAPVGKLGQAKGGKTDTQVTLSGLLNALDGIVASEGRIFVATTNHLEKIDSALSRPGEPPSYGIRRGVDEG